MTIVSFLARKPYVVVGCSGSLALFLFTSYIIAKEYAWHRAHIQPHWKPYTRNRHSVNNVSASQMCPKDYFSDVLLIISFGVVAEYEAIPLFELMYSGGFPNRIYCGPQQPPNETQVPFVIVDTKRGAFQYDCLIGVIEQTPRSYQGYMFVAEEIIVNYLLMVGLDLSKVWIDGGIWRGPSVYAQIPDNWEWWASPWGTRAVEKLFETLIELSYGESRKSKLSDGEWEPPWDATQALNSWLWNGRGTYYCYRADRTIAYIPQGYTHSVKELAKKFRSSGVRHAIAFPTMMNLLDRRESFVSLTQVPVNGSTSTVLDSRDSLTNATETYHFLYVKGGRSVRRDVLGDLKIKELAMGHFLMNKLCS